MTNRELKKSFRAAIEYARLEDDLSGIFSGLLRDYSEFNRAVKEVNDSFPAFYAAAKNNRTKKALIKSLTDFVVLVAEKPPVDGAIVPEHAEAIHTLCDTINKTVQDKSLIRAYFPAQLLSASFELFSAIYQEDKRADAYNESKKISTAAFQFFPAPASKKPATQP